MRPIRRIVPGAGLVLLVTALSACASSAAPPGTPSPTGSASATAPAAPSPTASSPSAQPSPPAGTVVSSQVAYPWHWPNDDSHPASITHRYPVPPVPQLLAIAAGDHPAGQGDRAYNRMSFTFAVAFPSYQVLFVRTLTGDASGQPIPLAGNGVLKVTFREAQAHTASGASSVMVQPPVHLGLRRMVSWARAGDNEGVLTFGIGIAWPNPLSNPQFAVRAVELAKVTAQGQHRYVVAIDIDAGQMGGQQTGSQG